MPDVSLAQLVWTIPLFADVAVEEREKLLQYALVDEFVEGHVLFHEGAIVGQHMYVILSGEVEILKKDKAGKDTVLATLRRSHFFGEMSLIEQEKRSATARVKTKATILVITRTNFDLMMKAAPAIANKMLLVFVKTLSHRLRNTSDLYASEHKGHVHL
jgi:CRP/FNR family transcriptional regulator, cyclic AMP receptor protein